MLRYLVMDTFLFKYRKSFFFLSTVVLLRYSFGASTSSQVDKVELTVVPPSVRGVQRKEHLGRMWRVQEKVNLNVRTT
jgi:hypothetical protein